MKVLAAGVSDVGCKRTHNEDNFFVGLDHNLFVVADGMGGHACGEVASELAVLSVGEFFRMTADDEERTWPFKEERGLRYQENRLVTSIKLANRRIYDMAQLDIRKRGMGTTIVTALIDDGGASFGHCGDSRAYRVRGGAIEQLTEDHSLLNEHIKSHHLTKEEIATFPHKNVIVRALGMKDTVKVDVGRFEALPGDVFVLCSDGLSGMVSDEDLGRIVNAHFQGNGEVDNLSVLCGNLIDAANSAGGIDNVTCICILVQE